MKILWLSNIIFPQLCREIGLNPPVGGGWIQSGAEALIHQKNDLKLGVVSFYKGKELRVFKQFEITYYLVPEHTTRNSVYDNQVELYLKKVNTDFKPDIVHIHGTEYGHSLAQVKACGSHHTIVSIQGLTSFYKNYYLGGISEREVRSKYTLRDIIRRDSLITQQEYMAKRGELEIELLKSVHHIIGRTSWDHSCVWSITPKIKYHFCNETLRNSFYCFKWSYDKCKRHSIFLSQGQYPLKGLHQIIKALPLISRDYPDTEVFVAGNNFFSSIPFYRKNGYANYVHKLMKENNVQHKFHFLGQLSEEKMVEQYLKANVFICPSAIENSPNSVGEAQLLGTPCIASYVGGIMDMVHDNETGLLYRFEEIPLLANHVCRIFSDNILAQKLSVNERKVAALRHNKETNTSRILEIYKEVAAE